MQAMIYHRLECGDIRVLTYQDKIVAFDTAEKQIGLLTYTINSTLGCKQLEIESLAVHKQYKHLGIKKRLVKAAEIRATVKDCQKIMLLGHEKPKGFWIKAGFQTKDRECSIFSKPIPTSQITSKL